MAGARALRDAGRAPGRRAVIGEPTSLRPVRMHKGIEMRAVRLVGRSGHSSNPALGVSALDGMHRVFGAILDYRAELVAAHRHDAFEVPRPTLNLGRIQGGDAPNRICASCELLLDLRALPGMDAGAVMAELDRRVAAAVEGTGLELDLPHVFDGVPAFETPADAELVRVAEELSGAPAGAVAFGTEGPFFDALGVETVVLGPGSIDVAHQPNEYLPLASVKPTVDLLRRMIGRFCAEGEP